MNSLKKMWLLPLVLAVIFTACPTPEQEFTLKAVELTAGANVDAEADDTGATVTFTGAAGLALTPADFTISEGGAIDSVAVDGNAVSVMVSFAANDSQDEAKTYTVGISSASKLIKGGAAVTITQSAAGDTRKTLTAGSAVTAAASDTSAPVTFSGATGLTVGDNLETADFTVSAGGTVSTVAVDGEIATVTITFGANNDTQPKIYTVGISSGSENIKGSSTVTITQAGKTFTSETAKYVSFSTGNDGNPGTEELPWKTIAKVNSHTFNPGEAILFKSGDTWTWDAEHGSSENFLAPQGSGAEGNPIIINSYGTGAKPKLDGKALVKNVIRLHNQQYWEISNLEITSMAAGWTNPTSRTDAQGALINDKDVRGIYISGDSGETLNGFNLHDLNIHDVTGVLNWIGGATYINNPAAVQNYPGSYNQTGWDASKKTGAIIVDALKNSGHSNPTIFNKVTIENNELLRNSFGAFTIKQAHGGSSGVKWADPAMTSYPYNTNTNWKPHTNIVVRGNYIDQSGYYHGDGIYLTSVKNGLVEKNVIKNPGVCGIEMYWSDSITVQYNEVYGSTNKGGGNDTNGIDPDVRTSNIIVQYNYVHDNGDGILICGNYTSIIRYNILYNNTHRYVRDVTDRGYIQVYNNIMYNTVAQVETPGTILFSGRRSSNSNNEVWEFKNNVFYNAHAGTTASYFDQENNFSYANNLYYGIGVTPPAKDATPITADPGFAGLLSSFPAKEFADSAAKRVSNFDFLKPGAGSPLINQGAALASTTGKIDIQTDGKDYAGVTLSGKEDIGLFSSDFKGLAGFVTNEDDDKVPGAEVTIDGQTAVSDADGRYSFANVAPGSYTITVTHEDYEDAQQAFSANADAPSYLILKTGEFGGAAVFRDVSGTITSGGSPLAGVTVTIGKNGNTAGTATSGANGAYTITNVPSGSDYTITASKEDYDTNSITGYQVPRTGNLAAADIILISSTHVYYEEDFDTLDDWNILSQGEGHTVEIVEDADDHEKKYLHINKTTSGSSSSFAGIVNKTNAGAQGVFTYEIRLKRSLSSSSGNGQYSVYSYQADKFTGAMGSANPSANIAIVGGKIKTHFAAGSSATTDIQTYEANTWYTITLRIDTATDTFVFYVDGVNMGNGNLRTAVNTLDKITIGSGTSGSGFDDLWVDYIKMYQGEPQF
jgi:parallel beta-helix repeat protein